MEQQIVRQINSIPFILKDAILKKDKELIYDIYTYLINQRIIDSVNIEEDYNILDTCIQDIDIIIDYLIIAKIKKLL